MVSPRIVLVVVAVSLGSGEIACTQLDPNAIASLRAVRSSPQPDEPPLLPGRVGGDAPSPLPSETPRPVTPVPDPTPTVPVTAPSPVEIAPTSPPVDPSAPYGGLAATDLVVVPERLIIGVKTPASLTPVLPDTGVFVATVTLRDGSRSSRVTWQSASPGVLSIDENGVCKALDEGPQVVQVTARTLDGAIVRTVYVEMRNKARVDVILDDTEDS